MRWVLSVLPFLFLLKYFKYPSKYLNSEEECVILTCSLKYISVVTSLKKCEHYLHTCVSLNRQKKHEQADGRQPQMNTVDVSACLEVHVVSCTGAKGQMVPLRWVVVM